MNRDKKPFVVRAYGRTELAQHYYPNMCADSAWCKLKLQLSEYPGLMDALIAAGYTGRRRTFTPMQVEIIVDSLGFACHVERSRDIS